VKVFITHGGLLSTQESVYHGVPIIGIPIFGDQKMNTKVAVESGYGYFLDLRLLDNEEHITKALNTVLNDPK
jgi:UDP:flavonoid glycosyltransferase YjiC (YdhE family)